MACAPKKIIIPEVSGHIQSRISHICGKKTVFAVLVVTKMDRVVTYNEVLPPIKLRDSLIPWSCEIM